MKDHLSVRLKKGVKWCKKNHPDIRNFHFCGGVSSNKKLQKLIRKICLEEEISFSYEKNPFDSAMKLYLSTKTFPKHPLHTPVFSLPLGKYTFINS